MRHESLGGRRLVLQFSEIRRRRRADSGFLLQRRQEMDAGIFGDPTKAQAIFVVSHPWLTPTHADPEGLHLDCAISTIEASFDVGPDDTLLERWEKWLQRYYLDSEGDCLVFFDMSSLYQWPRTDHEETEFRRALCLMSFLYHSFPVIIASEIPEQYGYDLSYMDKGWCWCEANSAFIGNQLWMFSPHIVKELEQERRKLKRAGLSLEQGLLGQPSYPPAILQKGQRQRMLEFRETQTVKGKVFSNGSFDFPVVARILATVQKKREFEHHLFVKDLNAVMNDFADDMFFSAEGGGPTREEFANTVFDLTFTTPLHFAVATGSAELVEFLFTQGAKPRRDWEGRLPWDRPMVQILGKLIESPFQIPGSSAAAKAARTWSARERSGNVSRSFGRVPSETFSTPGALGRTVFEPSEDNVQMWSTPTLASRDMPTHIARRHAAAATLMTNLASSFVSRGSMSELPEEARAPRSSFPARLSLALHPMAGMGMYPVVSKPLYAVVTQQGLRRDAVGLTQTFGAAPSVRSARHAAPSFASSSMTLAPSAGLML